MHLSSQIRDSGNSNHPTMQRALDDLNYRVLNLVHDAEVAWDVNWGQKRKLKPCPAVSYSYSCNLNLISDIPFEFELSTNKLFADHAPQLH